MKMLSRLLLFVLLALFGAACADHALVNPATTCRLTEINGASIDGVKTTFTYDANGRVSRMVRQFDDQFGVYGYDYRFSYDASGRLEKSVSDVLDDTGSIAATLNETYTWTNGRITRFNWEYTTGEKGVNNLTYNAAGQLIGFTFESMPADPVADGKWTYTYDANGVLINRLVTSLDGQDKLFEAKLTYTGGVTRKTAFSLMAQTGLPVDPILARPWESVYPGNGAVLSYSEADASGTLQLFAQGTIKDMMVNQSGIITGWNYEKVTGDLTPVKFMLTGCP
jgi:5-hydroxyisourate hydrolase-like protein (transthyretin family)